MGEETTNKSDFFGEDVDAEDAKRAQVHTECCGVNTNSESEVRLNANTTKNYVLFSDRKQRR